MKRFLLGLTVAAAAAFAAPPASADGIVYCGITPRIPCGYCHTDVTTGQRICLPGELEG